MRRDELRLPLRKRGVRERLWAKRPTGLQLASLAAVALFGLGGIWLVTTPYPDAGQPVITAKIPPVEELKTASVDKVKEDAPEPAAADDPGDEPDSTPQSVEVIEPQDYSATQTEASIIVAPRRALPRAPIPAVTEDGPYGPLPKIGSNNRKASVAYARMTSNQILISDMPKIALYLGGMGLNPNLTQKAISTLPGDITLAFAPYGENLQVQVDKARAQGHEVLLQLPMEPFGYPASNPGPKTLLNEADANANLDALMWHMGRFTGYSGITNYMGAHFMSDARALRPVFAEMKRRGLSFLDDGTAAQSQTMDMGRTTGLPVRQAQGVIDAKPDAASIMRALANLENEARVHGVAIGTGTGLDITIEAVTEWSKTLADKGILLIPVSAAYHGRLG
ncbi:divergent polysaccharide deacetylase family protein [soil metagenome]